MAYRRTRKYRDVIERERQRKAALTRARNRLLKPAPDYPPPKRDLRMRIKVERFDGVPEDGEPETHVFEMRRARRIDQYRVFVDGKPWAIAGLSRVLEGIRKANPRMLSDRAFA